MKTIAVHTPKAIPSQGRPVSMTGLPLPAAFSAGMTRVTRAPCIAGTVLHAITARNWRAVASPPSSLPIQLRISADG